MRFKLTMTVEKSTYGNKLPINYPYLVSAWIYRVISQGDAAYSAWLHDNAFRDGNKTFKFFVFSNLNIPRLRLEGDRLCILSDTISIYLSFLPERSTEEFIKGLFQNQTFTLGDRHSKVEFTVQQIELVPTPDLEKIQCYKTISPVVVAVKEPEGGVKYVSPDREDYPALLQKNLMEKYKAYYGKEFSGSSVFEFELLSVPKARLVTIKAGSREEVKIKGYLYSFGLRADEELVRLMHEGGLGEKNSMGFGMVEMPANPLK